MRLIYSIIFLAISFILSGCTSLPPLSFNVPEIVPAKQRMEAEVKAINVRVAPNQERTGNIRATDFELTMGGGGAGTVVTDQWKSSLQDAVDRKLLFKDNVPRTLTISVAILKFSAPDISFTRFTEVEARYEVTDRTTGETIWKRDINSEGRASVGEATLGTVGFRLSINKAVQGNISEFISQLETALANGDLR
jgi:hypothetical protein